MENFNCKKVNQEQWYTKGGGETQGARLLLYMAMKNIMTQSVKKEKDSEEMKNLQDYILNSNQGMR